jgi:hypothetical protein
LRPCPRLLLLSLNEEAGRRLLLCVLVLLLQAQAK